MPRRRRRSTRGVTGSRSRRRLGKRKAPTRPQTTIQKRPDKPKRTTTSRGDSPRSVDRREQRLQSKRPKRRNNLSIRKRRTTENRLPASLVPSRTHNEDASSRKTEGVCRKFKEARRAVIIANGFGGINNQRNYRPRRKC